MQCAVCNKLLVKAEGELDHNFKKRKTCSEECAEALRNTRKTKSKLCFCNNGMSRDHAPYCSWDCRLIAIKCKRWNIPLTMEAYKNHSAKLAEEQRQIDIKHKWVP